MWSALTLGRAWLAAGRPRAAVAFGGYEAWAGVLGGVLAVAEIQGFMGNRETLFDTSDEETGNIASFVAAWWGRHADARVTVKDLVEVAQDLTLPIDAPTEQGRRVRLGRFVASLRDQPVSLDKGRQVFVRKDGSRANIVLWRLEPAPDGGESGDQKQSPPASPPDLKPQHHEQSAVRGGESGDSPPSFTGTRARAGARDGAAAGIPTIPTSPPDPDIEVL